MIVAGQGVELSGSRRLAQPARSEVAVIAQTRVAPLRLSLDAKVDQEASQPHGAEGCNARLVVFRRYHISAGAD